MKLLLLFSLTFAALAAADKPARKAPAVPPKITIPAKAVKTEDGSYRYTDAQGKKWIYRQSPWGVSKVEDKPATAADRAAEQQRIAQIKATEDGEVIRFERPGPFGTYKWSRKKTELDETERAAWERQKTISAQLD